jgi:hypothetical protein
LSWAHARRDVDGTRLFRFVLGPLVLVVLVACDSGTSTKTRAGGVPNPTTSTTVDATTPRPAYSLPGGGFEVERLPSGFSPFGTFRRRMTGPNPIELLDFQSFVNAAAHKRVNVSVIRGVVATQVLDQNKYTPSSRAVSGAETGIVTTLTKERQIGWMVDPTTVAFVTGWHMSDRELFVVADDVRVVA